MSDHLPECPYSEPCPTEWRNARTIKDEGLPVPHRIVSGSSGRCVECGAGDCICDELRDCARRYYDIGIRTAQEIVAAIGGPVAPLTLNRAEVLSAIDALRGER
jgi:hypothetical protein